ISFGERAWLYRSNGALTPSLYATWTHPTDIESILLADYNLDGLDDLAVHASPTVELLRNQGFGQRLLSTAVIPVLAAAEELRPIDANGDSRPDLFLADKTRLEMYHVINGNLAGQTTLAHGLTVPTDGAPHVMAGDLDGDGRLYVIARSGASDIQSQIAGHVTVFRAQ
ncbi:MAG: FG-GAP repeat domain-containing protein, partial [Planctomycetota bacterium]